MSQPICTLIGDLGGTNCRLQLMKISDEEVTICQKRYLSASYKSLESVIADFLLEHGVTDISHENYPEKVVICVAGPVSKVQHQVQNSIHFGTTAYSTNLQWDMSSFIIANALQLGHDVVTLVNDFEAVGYGVLGLREGQYVSLTPDSESRPGSPIAVIGPGTGLGEAYLTSDRQGGMYVVNPSEGGHSTYAPTDMMEFNLLQYIQTEFSCTHASWERVCSGTGIRSVYRYLKHQQDKTDPLYQPANTAVYEAEKPTKEAEAVLGAQFPAQQIFELAKNGDDLCARVVELYLAALGRETGNLAAKILPYGGIYIAGGMGPKIRWTLESTKDPNSLSKVDTTTFLRNVHDKGRLKPFIDTIPVYLVLIDEIGLLGCIYLAKRIGRK